MRSRSLSTDVVFLPCQASLNSSMDSLKAELNTALQYDREAEDEVKKLKVSGCTFLPILSCMSCTSVNVLP